MYYAWTVTSKISLYVFRVRNRGSIIGDSIKLACTNVAGLHSAVGRAPDSCKSEVLGLIPGLATYFRFSFR